MSSPNSNNVPLEGRWYKQKEIAEMLRVQLNAVRQVVAVLERVGNISTQPDFEDRRYTLVHESAIPTIRKALGLPG
jgi:DNA-binding MarR family transcriptional regulator